MTDAGTAKIVLLGLAETVAARLRNHQVKAEVVSVGIRTHDLQHYSHQAVLDSPTNITQELYREAARLFDEMWDGTPIRQLGIQTGRLSEQASARLMKLFDTTDYEKLERLDQAVDKIRKRFGTDAVKRASFVAEEKLDHMPGKQRGKQDKN